MARTKKAYPDHVIFERAAKFTRLGDFRKFDNKGYQAAHRRGLLPVIRLNMEPSLTEAYSMEEFFAEASKHDRKTDFRKANQGLYDSAYKRGVLDIICANMPENDAVCGEDHHNFKWPTSLLQERANKYTRKIDFLNGDPNAYAAAYVKGVLEEICSNMDESYHSWTEEEATKLAALCSSIGEFQERFYQAYQFARRVNIIGKICVYAKPPGGSSRAEREILAIVKESFSEARKLIGSKVSIEEKPYIKRFDIDVYVESLNKGVEFDGKRHHSFEYMRRSRTKSKWSDEDIRNYHELKDSHFNSLGISILHIKEQAWLKDKQACIKEIKDFFGIGS